MSNILFRAGTKGGTGKSTAARFLVTYLREYGADPLLLDLDDENRTFSRFFPEALPVEIKKKSSHDILVERALSGNSLIIADLKVGTGREVLDWWLDVPFEGLQSLGLGFGCIASVTSSPDSVHSFLNWVAALRDRVIYVVFRNLKDGDYLSDYDESEEALSFRQKECHANSLHRPIVGKEKKAFHRRRETSKTDLLAAKCAWPIPRCRVPRRAVPIRSPAFDMRTDAPRLPRHEPWQARMGSSDRQERNVVNKSRPRRPDVFASSVIRSVGLRVWGYF